MKKTTIQILIAGLLLVLVACGKEGAVDLELQVQGFRPDSPSKMQINPVSGASCWSRDQEARVCVNGDEYPVVYTDDTRAVIQGVTANDGGYTLLYPASAVRGNVAGNADVRFFLDSIQPYITHNGRQQLRCPMAGISEGSQMAIVNLASVVGIRITNPFDAPLSMKQVVVSSTTAFLSGPGTVTFDGTPTLGLDGDAHHQATLLFPSDSVVIAPAATDTFYIILPAFGNSDLTIRVHANTPSTNYEATFRNEATSLPANLLTLAPAFDQSDRFTAQPLLGEGNAASPHLVGNKNDLAILTAQLEAASAYRSAYYLLTSDIDCGNDTLVPITALSGTFDGGGHTITINHMAYREADGKMSTGIFSLLKEGATVKNLTTDGAFDIAYTEGREASIGVICGRAESGSTIANCTNNASLTVTTTSTVNKLVQIGGICGTAETNLNYCTNNGSITVNTAQVATVGGVVGLCNSSTLIHDGMYNTGDITVVSTATSIQSLISDLTTATGGIIGTIASGHNLTKVVNCYNTGHLSVTNNAVTTSDRTGTGGIVGAMASTSLIGNCYNTGAIDVVQQQASTLLIGGILGAYTGASASTLQIEVCLNSQIPTLNGASHKYGLAGKANPGKGEYKLCVYPNCTICGANWTARGNNREISPAYSSPTYLNTLFTLSSSPDLYRPWPTP